MGDAMKNWLKKQLFEITAWTGFILILCALFAPRIIFIILGIILIATDDEKAKEWVKSKAPTLSDIIEKW